MRTKPLPEQQAKDVPLASVGLYLPPGALNSKMTVNYETTALGSLAGAAVEMVAQGGDNIVGLKNGGAGIGDLQAQFSRVASSLRNTFSEADYKSLLEVLVLKFASGPSGPISGLTKFFGDNVNPMDAAAAALGMKVNPRTEILFNSQQYRTHALDFILIPRSLQEAQMIDRILYFFQFYSLPRYSGDSDTALLNAFMIGFPYEFTINMLAAQNNTNVPLTHVNQIGRSVLTSVEIDHAAGTKTAFVKENGEFYPVATKLSLTFSEVRLLARGDDEIKRANLGELPDPRKI